MKKLIQIFSLLQKRFAKLSPVFRAVEVQLESVGICLQIGHRHQPTQPSKKFHRIKFVIPNVADKIQGEKATITQQKMNGKLMLQWLPVLLGPKIFV